MGVLAAYASEGDMRVVKDRACRDGAMDLGGEVAGFEAGLLKHVVEGVLLDSLLCSY
jgi:hypothetical protein